MSRTAGTATPTSWRGSPSRSRSSPPSPTSCYARRRREKDASSVAPPTPSIPPLPDLPRQLKSALNSKRQTWAVGVDLATAAADLPAFQTQHLRTALVFERIEATVFWRLIFLKASRGSRLFLFFFVVNWTKSFLDAKRCYDKLRSTTFLGD